MNKIVNYLKGSREELSKVVWPTRQMTINHTIMVISVSIGVALFLGLIDYLLNKALELVI